MAWSRPITRSTGFVPGATEWNEFVNDHRWFGFERPICKARRNTNLSIPNNANTSVTWDANNYDTAGSHSVAVNPSRFTCPVSGLYRFSTNIQWDINGTGARGVFIIANGTGTFQAISTAPAVSGLGICQFIQTENGCAAGDYFEVIVYQNCGGALLINGTGTLSSAGSWAYLEWIADL